MNVPDIVGQYLQNYPEDSASIERLSAQIAASDDLQGRKNLIGHITAAAIVLSPDHSKVLLIHHNFLNLWLQPGGHWDEDEIDTLHAAQREAEEETGVTVARNIPFDSNNPLVPIHIEVQAIPARPSHDEPAHHHYDFRYVFEAAGETLHHQEAEVSHAGWYDFDAPEAEQLYGVLGRVQVLINQ